MIAKRQDDPDHILNKCESLASDPEVSQKVLDHLDNTCLFISSVLKINTQCKDQIGTLMFTKDDELAVEFVTAAANIRAYNFAIGMESLFKIKEMAGKIVPAISSSNALVAALQTFEAVKILASRHDQIKGVSYVRMDKDKRLMSVSRIKETSNKNCQVCQDDS